MSDRPVLVSTCADDPTADLVIAELNDRGVPLLRIDPGIDFPATVRMSARLGTGGWTGPLTSGDRIVDFSSVRSLYHRRPSLYFSGHETDQDVGFAGRENRRGLGGVLHALPDCLYVNHPLAVARTEYKPVQLHHAQAAGFEVPATVITSELVTARAFAEEVGQIVYKPLHAATYTIDGSSAGIWVEKVDPTNLDERVAACAHLFQQFVPKVGDARAIVVGDEVFCALITTPDGVVDWRSDYTALTYDQVQMPEPTQLAVTRFMAVLGLVYGAFDFAVTDDGRWVFLECNPNGQWAWIEAAAELPIRTCRVKSSSATPSSRRRTAHTGHSGKLFVARTCPRRPGCGSPMRTRRL